MGEYAIRKSDRQRVKIGTCQSMYYCRYEQLMDILYDGSPLNCYWRISTPDEDGIEVGDFTSPSPIGQSEFIPNMLRVNVSKLKADDIEDMMKCGTMQLKSDEMGLLVNVRCPHGLPLDEQFGKPSEKGFLVNYGYNGLRDTLYVCGVKNTESELKVLIECRCCGEMWSFSFQDAEPLISSLWLKLRLLHQCSEYHYEHSSEKANMVVDAMKRNGGRISISETVSRTWIVKSDGYTMVSGKWELCRDVFIHNLPRKEDIKVFDGSEESITAAWCYDMLMRYDEDYCSKELERIAKYKQEHNFD